MTVALLLALLAALVAAGRFLAGERRPDPDRRDLAAIRSFSTARHALRRSTR